MSRKNAIFLLFLYSRSKCRTAAGPYPAGLDPILIVSLTVQPAQCRFEFPQPVWYITHTRSRLDAVSPILGNMKSLRRVSPLPHFRTQEDKDDYHYRCCCQQDSRAYPG